jgi:serum/glucocorticoid-regulated kinase 2
MNIKCQSEAKSMCGTLEYLSPEVVEGKGHGKPVDWWAIGCLIFEMLTGMPVFYADNREKMFQKIRNAEIKFPCTFSSDIKDLLSHLLEKNPDLRWGEGAKGASMIKEHSWFKTLDWESVYNKTMKAPYVPLLKNDLDLSYFDPVISKFVK